MPKLQKTETIRIAVLQAATLTCDWFMILYISINYSWGLLYIQISAYTCVITLFRESMLRNVMTCENRFGHT
jgi:hypothetical protein